MFRRLLAFLGFGRARAPKPLSSYASVPVDHPLRATLDARYLAMRDAMASGDGAEIAALLTGDFVSLDVDRKRMDARQMIERVLELKIDRSKRRVATTLVAIATSPGRAIVLQHYAMTSLPGAPATMPRSLLTMSVDTWVESDGTWLLGRTETVQVAFVTSWGFGKEKRRRPAELPFDVNARMWEYIEPIARGKRYEDPLVEFFGWSSLGNVEGGGSQLGTSPIITYVDIAMRLADLDGALDAVAAKLEQSGALRGSELQFTRDGRAQTRPFGTKECVVIFLDGISLPAAVYAESDINEIIADLDGALAGDRLGRFRSHWRGNRETALFFVGDDAEAMYAALRPTFDAIPLCQNARVIVRYGNHPAGPAEFRLPRKDAS